MQRHAKCYTIYSSVSNRKEICYRGGGLRQVTRFRLFALQANTQFVRQLVNWIAFISILLPASLQQVVPMAAGSAESSPERERERERMKGRGKASIRLEMPSKKR